MNKTADSVLVMQPTNNHTVPNGLAQHRREVMTPLVYLRTFWMDYLAMAVLGALGLGIYFSRPPPDRVFPVYFRDGEVVNPEFTYPYQKDIIPIWLAALLAFIIPFILFNK